MADERSSFPDWRDAAAYAALLEADRSLIAWEWLRRDPQYRALADRVANAHVAGGTIDSAAHAYGLIAFEPPDRGVPHARPLWSREVSPFVLPVARGAPTDPANRFDLECFEHVGRLVSDQNEHLLLCDGLRSIRLDGPVGTFTSGPVGLGYLVHGLGAAEAPLLTLRRFLALARNGRFSRLLHPPEKRARRWILLLRGSDALAAGASQREIAEMLLSKSAREARWRIRDPNLRLKVQRLVRAARLMSAGGFRAFLG